MTTQNQMNTEDTIAGLEAKLHQIENKNEVLSKDLEHARGHEKLRMDVHAEELRRAKAHCDKLDRIIDKTRKQASIATQRVRQIEKETKEAKEKSHWFKHQEAKESAKKSHRPMALLRSIF